MGLLNEAEERSIPSSSRNSGLSHNAYSKTIHKSEGMWGLDKASIRRDEPLSSSSFGRTNYANPRALGEIQCSLHKKI